MPKRILTAIVLMALALAGCAASPSAKESNAKGPKKLVVGLTFVPDIQFSSFYAAVERGEFTKRGLEVELRHHGSNESLFGALTQGREDVVFAGGDEAVQARSQGLDLVSFATIYQDYPVKVIVPEGSEIRSLKDLRGKKVGMPGPFGSNYFGYLVMLASAGLSSEDVTAVNTGYTLQAALASGSVDAVMGFVNSDAVRFKASGLAVRTLDLTPTPEQMKLISVGLISTTPKIEEHGEAYIKLLEGVEAGAKWAEQNPQEAVNLSKKYVPALSDHQLAEIAKLTLVETSKLYYREGKWEFGKQNPARWEAQAKFMESNKLLESPQRAEDSFVILGKNQ